MEITYAILHFIQIFLHAILIENLWGGEECMQKLFKGSLVALAMVTCMSLVRNEVAKNPEEETEEVDLMSILPFEY